MATITNNIIDRINGKQRGWVFGPADFLDLGSRAAVDKVLSRLVISGMIRRIDRGIYDFPKTHKLLGLLSPDGDLLAQAIANKTGDQLFPSGAMAVNMLGLATQVPAQPAYLTNGHSRVKKIDGRMITLKHARVRLLQDVPFPVNLTIQALSYMGQKHIDDDTIGYLARKLPDADKKCLLKATYVMPGWMVGVIHKIVGYNTPSI